MLGIDVSEHNGVIDWDAVKAAEMEFVIIRLGYGKGHLDSQFYANINSALAKGLKVGVYYYSYALDEAEAKAEGEFVVETLQDCGIEPKDLKMGIWFDMEDADGYKAKHGMPDAQAITNMCSAFLCVCNANNYSCGVYASLDWLENRIDTDQFEAYVPYWCAQWSQHCNWPNPTIWQYTDNLRIEGKCFDGNISF